MNGDTQALADFALALYGRAGVADACLALQERAQVDVVLLLWSLWRAQDAAVDTAAVAAADARLRAWRSAVIHPLRAIRRAMKPGVAHAPAAAAEALRGRIKAAEIEAEMIGFAMIERLASSDAGPGDPEAAGLAVIAHCAGRPAGDQDRAALRSVLAGLSPDRPTSA